MSFPIGSDNLETLDVMLAERVVVGGLRGQKLMESRHRRDICWIVGALGCRGVHVTARDVENVLQGTAGRFMPGQPEYALIRGMRSVIDHLETRAEYGMLPDGHGAIEMYGMLTAELFGLVEDNLRIAEPWETLPGVAYPRPEDLDGLLATFCREHAYHDEKRRFEALHPVAQAALLFRRFAHLAPFRDFNLLVGGLTASWFLLAHGYPPFLPQAVDKSTMRVVLAGRGLRVGQWFSEVLLTGYRAIAA